MAKDPAVLFYYQDFLVGTEFMDDSEVGIYIRLLCHLYDKNELSEKQVLRICSASAFENIPDDVKNKLKRDNNGMYFNQRARDEKEKRLLFTESRRKNALGIKTKKASAKHMEDENENENIIVYDNDIKNIVSEFYKFQSVNHKNQLNEWESNESLLNDSYAVIEKLHRIDKFSYDDIMLVLRNATNDEFWNKQIISLRGLRTKSKNGQTKFQNAAVRLLEKDVWDEIKQRAEEVDRNETI